MRLPMLRLLCLLMLLGRFSKAARPCRSTSQRSYFPSQPQLYVEDLDGDGIDEWIQIDLQQQPPALFIVDADFFARGRAYTTTPENSTTVTIASGAFLGAEQPRVACAVTTSSGGQTSICCGILHPARFEFEWIIPSHQLPFTVNKPGDSEQNGVDLIVGDFDGDGKDELLTYYSSLGSFSSYSLAASTSGELQFTLQLASIPIINNVALLLNSSPISTVKQSVYIGNLFGSPSFTESAQKRCVGFGPPRNQTILLPPEQLSAESTIPETPIDLQSQPKRAWNLDMETRANTRMPDSLLLVDPTSGVVQGFSACVQSSTASVEFHRILVTPSDFIPSDAQVSLAAVAGIDPWRDELVLYRPAATSPTGRLAVYGSVYNEITGGAFHRVTFDFGDVARAIKQSRGTNPAPQLAWMRTGKPRTIRPKATLSTEVSSATNPPSSSQSVWYHLPSGDSSSYLRHDPVLLLPSSSASSRMLQFIATFVTGSPKDRDATLKVDVESDATKETLKSASSSSSTSRSSPSPFGVRTYLFSFSQFTIDLEGDPDSDALRTRHELGGLDANLDGISDCPLHSYGASPLLPDVFVEIDFMADKAKSMQPRDGFDQPAKENLRAHGIVLHAFVDDAIPRVADLGPSGTFSWDQDIMPLKAKYFTPERTGLFHYCLFIDKFNSGSVSGQSRSVPGTEFFVSLGGWDEGRGSLLQQQGTFLHELGHQLNLLHGGNDDVNWKPNHLSVMNYVCLSADV